MINGLDEYFLSLKNSSYPTGKLVGSQDLDRSQVTGVVSTTIAQSIADTSNLIDSIIYQMPFVIPL